MKIKEGGVMDIQEKKAFEIAFDEKLGARSCQFDLDEDGNYEDRETLCGWHMWQAAKTQAVPEWKDYTVESPRIDGPYQIFIMNQQLVAKWESPWGFSSIEDGDALNQELITHWSVLGNDPAIEPREPAND